MSNTITSNMNNHEKNIKNLIRYYGELHSASEEQLMDNGFVYHDQFPDKSSGFKTNCFVPVDNKNGYLIESEIRNQNIRIQITSSGYRNLSKIQSYRFLNFFENKESNLLSYNPVLDLGTLRCSNLSTELEIKDKLGHDRTYIFNDFNDEAEYFQFELVSTVPSTILNSYIKLHSYLEGNDQKILLQYTPSTEIELKIPELK